MSNETITIDADLFGSAPPKRSPSSPVVGGMSPGGGGELMIAGEAYDGASAFSRELANWRPGTRSADSNILPEKGVADARARDTIRNDAFMNAGVGIHKDSIVGSQYLLNCKPALRILGKGFDDAWEEEFQAEVEERWSVAAESPNKWLDASRQNTFTEQIRLGVGVNAAGGEILATVEWLSKDKTRPFSTAIQMIDPDRLETPPQYKGDQNVRGGVRRDNYGAASAYFIRKAHPGDYRMPQSYEWKEVPARKPWGRVQVIHIFEQQLPDQTRGISEIVSALKESRMARNWRDVMLQHAVINASFAATIESELDPRAIFERMGGTDDYDKAFESYMTGYLSTIGQYVGSSKSLQMNGVRIPHLPPGSKLNLRPAGAAGELGTDFEKSMMRYLASAFNVSYEEFSRNFTEANYSGIKASIALTGRAMQTKKKYTADALANHVFRLWLEEEVNNGRIESLPAVAKRPGWLYEDPLRLDALAQCEWIGSSRGQIDELKETQAAVLRMNNNLSTLEDEVGRLGGDWRKRIKQRSREVKMLKDNGLFDTITDTTNMTNAAQGSKGNPKNASGAFHISEDEDEI